MLNGTRTTVMTVALAGATALLGCTHDVDPDPEVAEIQDALNVEDGGYTTADEAPNFGDPEVLATPELINDFADQEDLISTQASLPGMVHRRVFLMWGNLPPSQGGTAPTAPVDWTGDVTIDVGALGLRKTLVFDSHDGVLPRQSPQTVGFVSHTLPHVDGLLLDVISPPNAQLSFDTAALQLPIDLAQLDVDGRGFVPLGDGVNGLAFAGHVVHPGCAEGFLFGHWRNLSPDVGRFRGRVVASDGAPLGHVKGIYGYAEQLNEDVFFGKYVNQDGQFRGLLGGTYGAGAYQGLWKTVLPANHGQLGGRYFDGLHKQDGKGIFVGRWAEACGS